VYKTAGQRVCQVVRYEMIAAGDDRSSDITIKLPESILIPTGQSREGFEQEAKFLLASKLSELGRLSSGRAAAICGMDRATLLLSLHRVGVAAIDLGDRELEDEFGQCTRRVSQSPSIPCRSLRWPRVMPSTCSDDCTHRFSCLPTRRRVPSRQGNGSRRDNDTRLARIDRLSESRSGGGIGRG